MNLTKKVQSSDGFDQRHYIRVTCFTRLSSRRSHAAERESAKRDYYLPWFGRRLHLVGYCDAVGPHVVLPFLQPDHTTEHVARVDANAHVQILYAAVLTQCSAKRFVKRYLHYFSCVVSTAISNLCPARRRHCRHSI